jgi:oxalate decarboxylase/phosphoglucose isomerase-like protein (cupin superfamily)
MEVRAMPSKLVNPATLPTQTFEWGLIKPLVAKANTKTPAMSLLHVVLLPDKGHTRHNHPDADEILYVLSGHGDQMVDDGKPFPVAAGQAVFIPAGAFHSTINTGWEPLTLLAIYAPAGAEEALRGLPDFKEVPPGQVAGLVRS